MLEVAFKMLIGDRAKFLGLIFGIFLSSFLICQQASIFIGIVERSYRLITDIPTPEIWAMDPGTEHIDKVRSLPDAQIDRVKSIAGVLWAAPLAKAVLPIRLQNGLFHEAQVVAIDEDTLLGAPQQMIAGNIEGLRNIKGIILDESAINEVLVDQETEEPLLKIGSSLEVADRHAVLVGIAKLTRAFYPQPIMYMGFQQFKELTPFKKDHAGFILVRVKPGVDVKEVIQRIKQETGLAAFTRDGFKWRSILYFLGTGILINFGTTVLSGFLLGIAIVGIMFYMLTMDYLPYFAMLRAIGASPRTVSNMIYFQALISGLIGFGLGVGAAAIAGQVIISLQGSVAFLFLPQVLFLAAITVVFICVISAWLCIQRVLKEDPKNVMSK